MTQKIRSIIGQTLIMCETDELFTILIEEDRDSKIYGVAAPANSKLCQCFATKIISSNLTGKFILF